MMFINMDFITTFFVSSSIVLATADPIMKLLHDIARPMYNKTWFIYLQYDIFTALSKTCADHQNTPYILLHLKKNVHKRYELPTMSTHNITKPMYDGTWIFHPSILNAIRNNSDNNITDIGLHFESVVHKSGLPKIKTH